jgi:hypothetical protein
MPTFKYKTFEEAERAFWNFHPDESYFHKVSELWQFADKLCPISYPKGIFKFRSIEEANKQRNEWEMQHAKKIRSERNSSIQPVSRYTRSP